MAYLISFAIYECSFNLLINKDGSMNYLNNLLMTDERFLVITFHGHICCYLSLFHLLMGPKYVGIELNYNLIILVIKPLMFVLFSGIIKMVGAG